MSSGPQSPQLEGWEIQDLVADGSALISWSNDSYADCIYFYPNGTFDSDGYYVEYGQDYYFDATYKGNWHVQGNQLCIDAACYYAEWRNGQMWLLNDRGSYEASFPITDGPDYLYNAGCDIVF